MARRNQSAEVDVPEVEDTPTPSTEETATPSTPKAKKEPARGDLPEGFVTPHQLAKVLTERGLHTNRAGETVEVRPQMVYSYLKNAPKDDPFPIQTVTDSIGKERQAVNLDEGLAWWTRKNERVATRKQNAADKLAAKEKRAQEKAATQEAEGGTPAEPATEAE